MDRDNFFYFGGILNMVIIKKWLIYVLILLLDFYALPLLIRDTGSAMLLMLILIPLISLLASFVFGLKFGFSVIPAAITAVLFLPSIFLFYNPSAWVYSIGYGLAALLGTFIGSLCRKRKE